MFKFDKEDIKAIARRRARKGLVQWLEWGAISMVIIMLVSVFVVEDPSFANAILAVGTVGVILMFTSLGFHTVRAKRIFKDLSKKAGLSK